MPYGYVIAQISIKDPKSYAEYVNMVQPTLDAFYGEFLVRGGKATSYEGDPPGDRNVIIRFPSYDHAMNWYHSEKYSEAKKKRQAASDSVRTIVEGV